MTEILQPPSDFRGPIPVFTKKWCDKKNYLAYNYCLIIYTG